MNGERTGRWVWKHSHIKGLWERYVLTAPRLADPKTENEPETSWNNQTKRQRTRSKFLMVGQDGDKWLTAPNRYKTAQPVLAHSHHAEKVPGERMRTKHLTPLYLCIITRYPGQTTYINVSWCLWVCRCATKSVEICFYFKAKVTFLPMKDISWLQFRQSS